MSARVYKMYEGSLQQRFASSRNKIQIFGGGFANGKTAASIVTKVLVVAKDYPGANILVARSTYPKLNDTIRKEFLKWCPPHWIKSFPKTQDNTCTLVNGSMINFRYISQQGKSQESSTSNLLSANYDLIIVDQIEDPEISEKDFYDLLGRLRGMARYEGDDTTMPLSGPRWLVVTCNPTRNWFYRKIVKPLHDTKRTGRPHDALIVEPGTGKCLIDLFEGSTYENADNLEADYITTLEAAYRGQMRSRFLMGEWSAYEGLVYPEFDDTLHVVKHGDLVAYYDRLRLAGVSPSILEGYDHGLAVPSCYLWGFVDAHNNVFIADGHYQAETSPAAHSDLITATRTLYQSDRSLGVLADPSLFRRTPGGDSRVVGRTVADMFADDGIRLVPGNNDKINGIHKVKQYLSIQAAHAHPLIEGEFSAPRLFVSDKLDFVANEFNDYYWKKNSGGEMTDEPVDKNDHAMDTIKYMLSRRPKLAVIIKDMNAPPPVWMRWSEHEQATAQRMRTHRYG